MSDTKEIEIEVAYALPEKQKIYALLVKPGTTALEAAKQSPVIKDFGEMNLDQMKMGIFGQTIKKPSEYVVQTGERVEIYRPLLIDPKAARRNRAAKVTTS